MNEAIDQVRRAEQKERGELKGSRWVWAKNPANWTAGQQRTYERLSLAASVYKHMN